MYRLLLRLILTSLIATAFFNASFATASAPAAAVESALDQQADQLFSDFQKAYPHADLTVLTHAKRAAVYRIKQMGVVTDLLKASGHAPATALIAAEILSTFVVAPIAASMGQPAIAGVAVTVPWGLVAGFGVFSYQRIKQRYKIARSLGLYSLRSLDRVRELVVGYDLKHRVSTVVYQSLANDLGSLEFDVLRKSVDQGKTKTPAIELSELETFVRSTPEGVSYLQQIYLERLDSPLYSTLLLRFISESDELTEKLVGLVSTRLTDVAAASERSSALRQHLINVGDVRLKVDREIRLAQKSRAALKKLVKAGTLSKAQADELKAHFKKEIARFSELRRELVNHEYVVLLKAKADLSDGASVDSLSVSKDRATELIALSQRSRAQTAPPPVDKSAPKPALFKRTERRAVLNALTCSSVF